MNDILSISLQIMAPLLTLMVTAAVGVVAPKVNKLFKLKNEKLVKDALHGAIENGLKLALAKNSTASTDTLITGAINYAKKLNPDTVRRSGARDDDMAIIARSKLPDLAEQRRPAGM